MALSFLTDNISRVFYILTIFFNTSLIFLTVKFTRHIVGTYRNMIVTFAIFGIMLSTADILIRPLLHSYNGCFVYFTLGSAFRFSKKLSKIALLVHAGVYGLILVFLTVQFVYRALLLSKSKNNWSRHFDGWKLVFWIFYAVFVAVIWAVSVNFVSSDEITNNYLRKMVLADYGVEISTVTYNAILAYNEDGANKTVRWNSVQTIGTLSIIMTSHYIVMVICGIFMYHRTKLKFQNSSSAYDKLQKQFFHALIYQTTAPTLFFHLPVLFVVLAPFFDLKVSFNSSLVIYGTSAYPLVDTLILLKVVKEYKNAYLRLVGVIIKSCVEVCGEETPRNPQTLTSGAKSNRF